MEKLDYKKELKQFYGTKAGEPVVVQVPKLRFLMIDGRGDPNTSQEYIHSIETLYPVVYTIKFMCKKLGQDFAVMPLEGLWWAEDMNDFNAGKKDNWQWTSMIMVPDFVIQEIYRQAVEQVKPKQPPALGKLRLEDYEEGRAAQVMYVGPYSDEGPTIQKLHEFIRAQGGELTSSSKHHHEIYLGDPRRTAPEKLKTVIRQPF